MQHRTIPVSYLHQHSNQQRLSRYKAGEKTGSVSGPPPPVSSEVTDDIMASTKSDPEGVNVPGKDEPTDGQDVKQADQGSGGSGNSSRIMTHLWKAAKSC